MNDNVSLLWFGFGYSSSGGGDDDGPQQPHSDLAIPTHTIIIRPCEQFTRACLNTSIFFLAFSGDPLSFFPCYIQTKNSSFHPTHEPYSWTFPFM